MRAWLFNSASERVMARLRFRLFSHLMGQEMGFFDRVRTGELMNRLSEVQFALAVAATCAHRPSLILEVQLTGCEPCRTHGS